MAGGTINRHVIFGVLMGLIKSDLVTYGMYLEFQITDRGIQSLYRRMNLCQRMMTTSRPTVTRSIWLETRTQYLHDIVPVVSHSIPDELIINADQMPSKYVPTANVTMAEKNSKHVARKGANDKRGITVTLRESLSGEILPMQLIYKGKTNRSLPSVKFPAGFALTYNEKHWSNEKETINFIEDVLCPYIRDVKERFGLDVLQKSLLLWDAFKAHSTNSVI